MAEVQTVRSWMTAPVLTIEADTALAKAHMMMKEHGVRRLPVLKEGRLVGIITVGDVREASPSDATSLSIWELNYLWSQIKVERVMKRHPITVEPDDPIGEVAQIMLDYKISGLPVIENEKLVGIITESDLFRVLVQQYKGEEVKG